MQGPVGPNHHKGVTTRGKQPNVGAYHLFIAWESNFSASQVKAPALETPTQLKSAHFSASDVPIAAGRERPRRSS